MNGIWMISRRKSAGRAQEAEWKFYVKGIILDDGWVNELASLLICDQKKRSYHNGEKADG